MYTCGIEHAEDKRYWYKYLQYYDFLWSETPCLGSTIITESAEFQLQEKLKCVPVTVAYYDILLGKQ
eukprot:6150517-Amphidinium_carterae.1